MIGLKVELDPRTVAVFSYIVYRVTRMFCITNSI